MEPDAPSPAPAGPLLELAAQVLEHAPELVAIAGLDGALLYLNRAARAVLALAPDAPLAGFALAQLQPGWAWQVVQEEAIPAALLGLAWSGETAALKPGGGEFPVSQEVFVLGTAPGERRLASVMRDLSEIKRRDVERMETVNRYETAIRLSGHVLLDWEPFTGQLNCSGDLHGVLGRHPSELTDGFRSLRALVHPDDVALLDEQIQRTVTTRNTLSVNFRIRDREGAYRQVRAAGGFYLDREGRYGRLTALLMKIDFLRHAQEEVTRLRAQLELSAEDQVRQARAETERAKQAKGEFLSRMSHELRTPLNAILGFTQLLDLEKPTASQRESIEHITRAGNHLLSLVNEVLDLARLESGRLPLSVQAVDLTRLLHDALELMRPAAARAGVTLTSDADCPPPAQEVQADPQRLSQVVVNLLSNGIKFNRRGGRVAIRCQQPAANRVLIAVADTGIGIAPERLPGLFTPLERALEPENQPGGVGIGLALSHGIVHALHGVLTVESALGEGSTFYIDLPLVPAEPAEAAAAPTAREEPPPGAARPSHQSTILYVEDQDLNLQLVKRVLADYPEYKLIATMQGSLAIDLAREHRPALILLDLNLPDLSGETILTRLKDDPALRQIPVIMVTADVIGHRLERLLQAGAAAYLTKPFKITEFIRVIRDTLAAHRPGR